MNNKNEKDKKNESMMNKNEQNNSFINLTTYIKYNFQHHLNCVNCIRSIITYDIYINSVVTNIHVTDVNSISFFLSVCYIKTIIDEDDQTLNY